MKKMTERKPTPEGERFERREITNERGAENLIQGDLIEFPRIGYAHWAVYVGDKHVIHLTSNEDELNIFNSLGGEKALIKKELIWKVAGTSRAYRNNTLDEYLVPCEPDEVVKAAIYRMENAENKPVPYNVKSDNCEHFVNWCRYHFHFGKQVDRLAQILQMMKETLFIVIRALFKMAKHIP